MNTRTITAALVAITLLVMALTPNMIEMENLDEIEINGQYLSSHHVPDGAATFNGTLTWQDDAWNSTWINCTGGLALVTPSDWADFVASDDDDPHNWTSWGKNVSTPGFYEFTNAPEGVWVVTAGIACDEDDDGYPRSAGGQYGDVHDNPPTINLSNNQTLALSVSFTLIEWPTMPGTTFVCSDGTTLIPFSDVNDGWDDCSDGSDEQLYDGDGNEINWFDCSDGTDIWMWEVNDGYDDCPYGEDEASGGEHDGFDCEENLFNIGPLVNTQIVFTNECILSQEDSDEMRAMIDFAFGNSDGTVNSTELTAFENAPCDDCDDNESDNDSGTWSLDGIDLSWPEITQSETGYLGTGQITFIWSEAYNISLDVLPSHTLIWNENYEDYNGTDADNGSCGVVNILPSPLYTPASIEILPASDAALWSVDDSDPLGDGTIVITESVTATGECGGAPTAAVIVFNTVGYVEPDTTPVCSISWTYATDTDWDSGTMMATGPSGDGNATLDPGSYMIAVECVDAEGDNITTVWSSADDATLSSSETGTGTVFGWVAFTIGECLNGSLTVSYEWSSGDFSGDGQVTFHFAGAGEAACDDTTSDEKIEGTGGGIPGFTGVMMITAMLGAVLYLGRRN